ncbi:MAG: ribosome small subunit-dependent GTPase A [Herpetosiphonaceae bacterium]|nr:ribosome small subunit-dependent GTPase A [Herpetosiphonaceae bacterium]
MIGTILRAQSGFFWVQLDETGETLRCVLRGRLKKIRQYTDLATLGDRVRVMATSPGEGAIEEVYERRTKLARKSPKGGGWFEQIIVANIDLVLVTFAVANPEPHVRMIDRFLVVAEQNGIDAAIIANKCDLADDHARSVFKIYEQIGYPVIYTSAARPQGIEEVRALIRGKISAFSGPSGVGKSSLLNVIQPGLALRTGAISDAVRKGQHTTVAAELIPLHEGGFVADTPGIRELGLYHIPADEVEWCFREFRPFLDDCAFANCTHDHEPDCAVRAALQRGEISAERYESYLKLYEEAGQIMV